MSTKLWYSTIGHLATLGLSVFFGVARACAHAPTIFTAVSKRDEVNQDANESLVPYFDMPNDYVS